MKQQVIDKKNYIFICSHCKNEISYIKGNRPEICNKCNHPYSAKPKTEYQLAILQDKLKKCDFKNEKLFNTFYVILYNYIKKLILKKIKNKIFLSKEYITEKIHDTISKLYIYYKNPKEDFRIEGSFGGYLNMVLLDILYNRKRVREENHDSLNFKIDEDKKKEMVDNLFKYKYSTLIEHEYDVEGDFLKKEENKELINKIILNINYICEEIKRQKSIKDTYLFLLGIYFFFNKEQEKFIKKFYEYSGTNIYFLVENTKNIIRQKLYDK